MNNQFNSDEENFVPSYANFWKMYSKTIIDEFKTAQDSKTKFMLFPLNSEYIQKKYFEGKYSRGKIPKIETS